MKRICTFLGAIVIGVFLISGCKPKAKPLSEIIGRVWSAQVVKEGSATVYLNEISFTYRVRDTYTRSSPDYCEATVWL